jgi:hypothetical protein
MRTSTNPDDSRILGFLLGISESRTSINHNKKKDKEKK